MSAAFYMYQNLGVQWATLVLGFIALGLMPVPLLFFIYGARIRKLSKFVPKPPHGTGPRSPPAGDPPAVAVPTASGLLLTLMAPPAVTGTLKEA
jgi:hypothetical protein